MANTYAAYGVYYYGTEAPSNLGVGMAGRITDNASAITPIPDMDTSLIGNPIVEGFITPSNTLRVAATDYDFYNPSPRTVKIFDATTTSNTPLNTISGGWTHVTNLYALVKVGSYLYALDYDNARVVEIDPSNGYAETGIRYTLDSSLNPDPDTYTAHGQALLNIGGTLFGLFTFVNSDFTDYAPTLLVKFTIVGDSSITVGVNDSNGGFAPNSFAMAVNTSDSHLYVASIGGRIIPGSYNSASAIEKIDYTATSLIDADVDNVMSPSSSYPYNFLDISFKGSTAYILMGVYNSSYTALNGVLLSTTNFSSFTTINSISTAAGYYWAAQYTADNQRLWFARGNPIWVYDASSSSIGSPVAELTISSGSLLSSSEPYPYDNLGNFSYVGASGSLAVRGYRSPIQVSHTPRAARARAIAKGRPELTEEELAQLNREIGTK